MTEFYGYSMSRSLDELGRVVIPKEMRNVLGWQEKDNIFIGCKDGVIYMKKFEYVCPICKNPFDNKKGLNVCDECVDEIKKS